MTDKKKTPKKGASRKWANRLKELAQQSPPEELVKKINEKDQDKKIAQPTKTRDLEL